MIEYNKINTIYKRDINNIIMPYSGFVLPEIEWMKDCKFEATEKIDGTNTSIHLVPTFEERYPADSFECPYERTYTVVKYKIEYHGKTDRAQMPSELLSFLQEKYPLEKMLDVFGLHPEMEVEDGKDYPTYIVYGEGYGRKIQAGGNYIKNGVSFIVFDVRIGDWYLLREGMLEIAEKMGAETVPFIGLMTVDEAVEYVRKGFKSVIAENKDYNAEGLVLKSPYGIRLRNGHRLIFKIKTCDWAKYFSKYGTYEPVEQIPNPKAKSE